MRFLYGAGSLCAAALAIMMGCRADQSVVPGNRAIPNVAREESVPDLSEAEKVCGGYYYSATNKFDNCESLVITASPEPGTNIDGATTTIHFSIPVTRAYIDAAIRFAFGCTDDRGVPTTCMGKKGLSGTIIGYDTSGAEVARANLAHLEKYSEATLLSRIGISTLSLIPSSTFGESYSYDLEFDIYNFSVTKPDSEPPAQEDTIGIRIISAKGPNGGSFTTLENKIQLLAEVTSSNPQESDSVKVKWIVKDDPADQVTSIPPAKPPEGVKASFDVPTHPLSRWRSFSHKGLLSQKSLSYVVKAVATKGDKTAESQEVKVTQNEMDTMRQEYIDFGFPKPANTLVHKAGDPGFPTSLFNQLNQGDYSIAFISSMLPQLLGPLLSVIPNSVEHINSGFRNPVHHRYHVEPNGPPQTNLTPHAQGIALDLSVGRSKNIWDRAKLQAILLGLCIEPLKKSTLSHIHVDWRGGRQNCPIDW